MQRREDWLGALDGRRLFWQAWLPDQEATRGVAVVVHGVAEHGGRYDFVGQRLAAAGVAVYALDHRGHGRSDGPRAFFERLDLLVDDLRVFVARIVAPHAPAPPFLIGHSLGGAVSISYALRHPASIAGLVLSGPAVATEAVSPAMLTISRIMSAALPRLPVFKLDERLISRDDRVVQAYREDPLVYSGKLPARTLWQILRSMRTLPQQVGELRMPLLLLHGGEDQLCPPSGSQMIYERAGAADRTLKLYPGLYHEIFNEPEREAVVGDVIEWLAERALRDERPTGPVPEPQTRAEREPA
jgi:alpha-beta hydrolase superfamily lysophospholipase